MEVGPCLSVCLLATRASSRSARDILRAVTNSTVEVLETRRMLAAQPELGINFGADRTDDNTNPLIEGRPLEFRARRTFRMSGSESDQTIRTGTGASWQFS